MGCAHAHPLCPPLPAVWQNCTYRSGAPRAANGDTLFYPWHHSPLLLLKKETNIHPEGTGDGERKEERLGGRPRKGALNPSKPAWHGGRRHTHKTRLQREKDATRNLKPSTFFLQPRQTATFPVVSREISSIFSRWWSWIIAFFLDNNDEF